MSNKTLFVFYVVTLFVQVITAQCLINQMNAGYATAPHLADRIPVAGQGCCTGIAASNGGSLSVTSASPIAPTGLVVTSENAMEGPVAVGGQLPLLGSVTMDGAFPSAGAGAISYACGDGTLGIASEAPVVASPASAIIAGTPATAAPLAAIAPATPVIAAPAFKAPALGSSFSFGPGKSPFAGLGARGQVGRGCGFRY